jgi:hypothetical protein
VREITRGEWIVGTAVVLECVAGAYLFLVTSLLSGWYVGKSAASHMSPRDWWMTAAERLVIGAVVAAVFAVLVFLVNYSLVRWLAPARGKLPRISGVIAFATVLIAAIAGALSFAISKPFM